MLMTDFTITLKHKNVSLNHGWTCRKQNSKEMDHVDYDEQVSTRFFHFEGAAFDIADFHAR